MAKAYTNIFKEYGWRRVAMVMSYGYCELPAPAIYSALQVCVVFISFFIISGSLVKHLKGRSIYKSAWEQASMPC